MRLGSEVVLREPVALPGISTDRTYPYRSIYHPNTSSRDCKPMPSLSFQQILDAALADYNTQVGIDLAKHPLADRIRSCRSPNDVLKLLEDKANEFKDFRAGNRKLLDWLSPVVQIVHTLSAVLGASTTSVSRSILVVCPLLTTSATRFRSGRPRQYLLAWMF